MFYIYLFSEQKDCAEFIQYILNILETESPELKEVIKDNIIGTTGRVIHGECGHSKCITDTYYILSLPIRNQKVYFIVYLSLLLSFFLFFYIVFLSFYSLFIPLFYSILSLYLDSQELFGFIHSS